MVDESRRKFLTQSMGVVAGQALPFDHSLIKTALNVLPQSFLSIDESKITIRHLQYLFPDTYLRRYEGGFGELLYHISANERADPFYLLKEENFYSYAPLFDLKENHFPSNLLVGQILDSENFETVKKFRNEFMIEEEAWTSGTYDLTATLDTVPDGVYDSVYEKDKNRRSSRSSILSKFFSKEQIEEMFPYNDGNETLLNWQKFVYHYAGGDAQKIKELKNTTVADLYLQHIIPTLQLRFGQELERAFEEFSDEEWKNTVYQQFNLSSFPYVEGESHSVELAKKLYPTMADDLNYELEQFTLDHNSSVFSQDMKVFGRDSDSEKNGRVRIKRIGSENGNVTYKVFIRKPIQDNNTIERHSYIERWLGATLPFYKDHVRFEKQAGTYSKGLYSVTTDAPAVQMILDQRASNKRRVGEAPMALGVK